MSGDDILKRVKKIAMAGLDSSLFYGALRLQQLYRISCWDAQIVAAADPFGRRLPQGSSVLRLVRIPDL